MDPSTDLLKDNRCTTRRNKCLERPDKESTEAIERYFHDGTETKNTESHCMTKGRREHHIMLYDRIAVEKHIYVATQNSKHWILTIFAERPQHPSINEPTFLKRKENANGLHDEHLARTQEDYRTIPRNPRNQQVKQRKDNTLMATNKMTARLTRIAGQPANSFVIVVNVGPNPVEDDQLEFSAFFKP